MSSSINPNWPQTGAASTSNVRANFSAAKSEIESLQTDLAAVESDVAGKADSASPSFTGSIDGSSATQLQVGTNFYVTPSLNTVSVSGSFTVNGSAAFSNALGSVAVDFLAGNTTGTSSLTFSDTSGIAGRIVYDHSDDSMSFTVATSERLLISDSSNFGVTTTSPSITNEEWADGDPAGLVLNSSTSGGESGCHVMWTTAGGEPYAGIKGALRNGVGPAGSLHLLTRSTSGNVLPRLNIASDGKVGIGTLSAAYDLDVSGTFRSEGIQDASTSGTAISILSNRSTLFTSSVYFPSGTAAAPTITFTSDIDTGLFSAGANAIGIAVAGGEALRIDASGRLILASVPTSDPAIAGAIWSDGGTLKVSAG